MGRPDGRRESNGPRSSTRRVALGRTRAQPSRRDACTAITRRIFASRASARVESPGPSRSIDHPVTGDAANGVGPKTPLARGPQRAGADRRGGHEVSNAVPHCSHPRSRWTGTGCERANALERRTDRCTRATKRPAPSANRDSIAYGMSPQTIAIRISRVRFAWSSPASPRHRTQARIACANPNLLGNGWPKVAADLGRAIRDARAARLF